MLRIFICPKCYNYRIVSRKPDAICFHCGAILHRSGLNYIEYTNMSEEERDKFKDSFIKRMMGYQEKIDNVLFEQEINK